MSCPVLNSPDNSRTSCKLNASTFGGATGVIFIGGLPSVNESACAVNIKTDAAAIPKMNRNKFCVINYLVLSRSTVKEFPGNVR